MVWPLGWREWTEPKGDWLRANEFSDQPEEVKKMGPRTKRGRVKAREANRRRLDRGPCRKGPEGQRAQREKDKRNRKGSNEWTDGETEKKGGGGGEKWRAHQEAKERKEKEPQEGREGSSAP